MLLALKMNIKHGLMLRHMYRLTLVRRKSTYFITTPIFYVNAVPHIGHLYTAVIADAVHRFRMLLGCQQSIFSTGTDEHGTKIQEAALKSGSSLPDYCNNISKQYRDLFDLCKISYTDYVRTTEDCHVKEVQRFWKKLEAGGHIYEGKYAGWYCTPDEAFLSENQLAEKQAPDGSIYKVSAESGHRVEWTHEENFMFRLSRFKDDLLHWLQNEHSVQPSKFRQRLVDFVSNDELLHDISVSRPKDRVHWGIPVPGTPQQTIYVWLDALVSYITVARSRAWPPDLQIVGKDILKFHGVYWPAFLIAAGMEPPYSLLCHSHWTVNGEKMSKSKGNIVDPLQCIEKYSVSGLRYFLLREGVPHSDGNYSETKAIRILNSELADSLGNLLNRCCGATVNPEQIFPQFCPERFFELRKSEETLRLLDLLAELPDKVKEHYETYNFYKGINSIIATLHAANGFFESQKPWELRKKHLVPHLNTVLHLTMETLRVCGIALQPVIPDICEVLLDKLGIQPGKRKWCDIKPFSWEKNAVDNTPISAEKVTLYRRILASK
ncbi:Methionine--tRNA ligase [Blattella germanica]|nr:Methionine--tRNA ligase [Blattella germanica]